MQYHMALDMQTCRPLFRVVLFLPDPVNPVSQAHHHLERHKMRRNIPWISNRRSPTFLGKSEILGCLELWLVDQQNSRISIGLSYLVLLPAKALKITPSNLIHGIRVTQVSRRLVILPSGEGVLRHTPTITETICQFEHGEDEFAFGNTALFHTGAECLGLDGGWVWCCRW